MMLTWLADVARQTGYPVIEVPGWQTRGHGPMSNALGVVGHWTATPASARGDYPSLNVVRNGRADLPGPLCNLGLARSGAIYVVAAGVAYHAGPGDWKGVTNGNGNLLGIEGESPGNFIWTKAQLDCYPRLYAALLRRMNRDSSWGMAHFEWANPPGRKPDGPARDMAGFRAKVQTYLNAPSTIKSTGNEGEDEMTPAQMNELLTKVDALVAKRVREELQYAIQPIAGGGSNSRYRGVPDADSAFATKDWVHSQLQDVVDALVTRTSNDSYRVQPTQE